MSKSDNAYKTIGEVAKILNLKTNNKTDTELIISTLKPPIFWKDKPMLVLQSKKWNKNKLKKALTKTYEVEINIKSNSSIRKDLLIKNLIVDLCNVANYP